VQEDISLAEYHVTWQEQTYLADLPAAYQAPNRAHDLRSYFTSDGIRVIRRTETRPTWELGLSLTGYGYEGQIRPVTAGELKAKGNGIEYQREALTANGKSWLTEWYRNDEQGLEQGFILTNPPGPFQAETNTTAKENRALLALELTVSGNMMANVVNEAGASLRITTPKALEDMLPEDWLLASTPTDPPGPEATQGKSSGDAIEFTTSGGVRVLRYSDLHAYDARGHILPVHLEVDGARVIIVIDDSQALYPITVDPLLTSPSWAADGGQIGSYLGMSVGTAGDVNGDGYSDVIVGAPFFDNGQSGEGRAFVYHGSANGLSASPAWTAESDQDNAQFGSVSMAGDVNGDGYSDIIVGAHFRQWPDRRRRSLRLLWLGRWPGSQPGLDGREQPGQHLLWRFR